MRRATITLTIALITGVAALAGCGGSSHLSTPGPLGNAHGASVPGQVITNDGAITLLEGLGHGLDPSANIGPATVVCTNNTITLTGPHNPNGTVIGTVKVVVDRDGKTVVTENANKAQLRNTGQWNWPSVQIDASSSAVDWVDPTGGIDPQGATADTPQTYSQVGVQATVHCGASASSAAP